MIESGPDGGGSNVERRRWDLKDNAEDDSDEFKKILKEDRRYACSVCGKRFSRESSLGTHMMVHGTVTVTTAEHFVTQPRRSSPLSPRRTWQTVTDLQRENTVALLHNSPLGRGSPPVPSREDDEQSLHGLIATEDSNLRLSKAEKSVSSVKNTGDTILAREHQHLKQARRRPSSARQTWGSPTVRSDIRTTAKSPQIRSEVSGLTQPEWESSLRIEYAPSPPRIVAAVRPAKSERRGGDGGAEDQRQAKVRSPHRPAVKPSHQTQASIKVGASPRTSRRLPQAPETTRGSRQREQLAIAGSRVTAAELFKAVEVETDLTLYKITTDSVAKENKTPPQTETSAAAVRDDFRAWLAWRSEETARAAAEATQAHFANVGSNLEDLTRTTDDSIVCSHFTN